MTGIDGGSVGVGAVERSARGREREWCIEAGEGSGGAGWLGRWVY